MPSIGQGRTRAGHIRIAPSPHEFFKDGANMTQPSHPNDTMHIDREGTAGEEASSLLDTAQGFDPVAYINDPDWHASSLGLQRIAELLERLGNPQDALRFVHVAGTNGKGSTCAFTTSILKQAGYRVGMFTSPYVVEFSERIQVDGCNISPEQLLEVTLQVREQAEAMDDHPTEFELMTAVALLHFAQQGCDIVVLEVGLGGRLDSTNIIQSPEVCVICPITFDHTDILGDTLQAIATEKAGIIKAGATVVVGVQPPEAMEVVRARAAEEGCRVACVKKWSISGTPRDFSYKEVEHVSLKLLGSYQVQNAATACEVAWALRERGFAIDSGAIERGLALTTWPARFELAHRNPDIIVDGGHNAQGARALVSSLDLNYPGVKPVFVMGVLADKDYPAMIATVLPVAQAFVCIEPPVPRRLPAPDLVHAILERREQAGLRSVGVRAATSALEAVQAATMLAGPDGLVCAFGSLYSVADIYGAIKQL